MAIDDQKYQSDDLITRHEAAKILGVKAQTLAKWASSKRYGLTAIRYGKRIKGYLRSDVLKFRDQHREGGNTI